MNEPEPWQKESISKGKQQSTSEHLGDALFHREPDPPTHGFPLSLTRSLSRDESQNGNVFRGALLRDRQ